MRANKNKKTGELYKDHNGFPSFTTWPEDEDPLKTVYIVEVEVIEKKELDELREKAYKYDQLSK